ncbi:MAG: 16S rRNA (guanine(527)-N(7))-methyltransferase RsmG, partial [Lutibacter sp.]|nr:16S rRNA (guanine(527)-N(7))-methyltransferase RsmG [Lutibacter sp.]
MDIILKYFPDLSENQIAQFSKLGELYAFWNAQINVISRKDIDE